LEALLRLSAGPVTDSMGLFSMEHLPDRNPKFVAAESEYLIHPGPGGWQKMGLRTDRRLSLNVRIMERMS
jgi:hypothetical protein